MWLQTAQVGRWHALRYSASSPACGDRHRPWRQGALCGALARNGGIGTRCGGGMDVHCHIEAWGGSVRSGSHRRDPGCAGRPAWGADSVPRLHAWACPPSCRGRDGATGRRRTVGRWLALTPAALTSMLRGRMRPSRCTAGPRSRFSRRGGAPAPGRPAFGRGPLRGCRPCAPRGDRLWTRAAQGHTARRPW